MKFLCIKYSGLRFYFIFETKDFVFIPVKEVEDKEKDTLDIEEIFSCSFDKNSSFYVLLKDPVDFDLTIEDFSEDNLYKFKLLEAILNLIFSNYLNRECIFILERSDSECVVKKFFKKLSKEVIENNPTLLWKNNIILKYLQELIDAGFDKFRSIGESKDFAMRYSFCINMYLRGKFGENRLRINSDLWISLEILSVITISHILHSHELFKVDNFYEELKEIIKDYSSRISKENIDCWGEMKDKFPEHIKNKINRYLPIIQKCLKVAEEYVDINDIKVKLKDNLEGIKEFKDYQDSITIKKIIKKLYQFRNDLFHSGKISDRWTLESDRYEANFIKILEQLFFKVLDIDMIYFYQMGYPHQKIFGFPNEEMDLLNLSNKVWNYIHTHYIIPKKKDFKIQFNDLEIARENYIDNKHKLDPLRTQLNSYLNKIFEFLNDTHPVELVVDGTSIDHSMNYKDIDDHNILLTLSQSSGIYGIIYNKKRVVIKNRDNANIITKFVGMFNEDDIRYGHSILVVPFLINPPYISFEFN